MTSLYRLRLHKPFFTKVSLYTRELNCAVITCVQNIARPDNANRQDKIFDKYSIVNPTFVGFEEISSY